MTNCSGSILECQGGSILKRQGGSILDCQGGKKDQGTQNIAHQNIRKYQFPTKMLYLNKTRIFGLVLEQISNYTATIINRHSGITTTVPKYDVIILG